MAGGPQVELAPPAHLGTGGFEALGEPGAGRVLVVAGGGVLDCALLGDRIAASAVANGWAGVVIHGCIRDSVAVGAMELGVKALGTCPRKTEKLGRGEEGVAVSRVNLQSTDASRVVLAARVLLRAGSDHRNVAGLDVEHAFGDLRDLSSLRTACAGCDGLYHVAADYRLWVRDPRELYASNVEGTRNVMRAALDASRWNRFR